MRRAPTSTLNLSHFNSEPQPRVTAQRAMDALPENRRIAIPC